MKGCEAALKKHFPNIPVKGHSVPGNTGVFDVFLVKDGQKHLCHSKSAGEGYLNESNIGPFVTKVQALLK